MENKISEETAQKIYNLYFDTENQENQIISVVGGWGSGKSTVKDELVKILRKETNTQDKIIVEFDALQFEEDEQITSELYNIIANNIKPKYASYDTINKLKAIAHLKKESTSQSISISHIWSICIIGFITFITSKFIQLPWVNKLFEDWGGVIIDNAILGNKLIIVFVLFVLLFWRRDWVLRVISGFLPRKSHVEILESIRIDSNKELVLFIDEIDRISPTALKLLFDEVIIMKLALKKANVKLKIFMLYDENVVLHNLTELNIYKPHIFLQKFYDKQFRLDNISFNDRFLKFTINNWRHQSIFMREVVDVIANNIRSFREYERIEDYFKGYLNAYNENVYYNNYNKALMVYFAISLKFFFHLRQVNDDQDSIYHEYLNTYIELIIKVFRLEREVVIRCLNIELLRLDTFLGKHLVEYSESMKSILMPSHLDGAYVYHILNKYIYFNINEFHPSKNNYSYVERYLIEKQLNLIDIIHELSNKLQSMLSNHILYNMSSQYPEVFKSSYIKATEIIRFYLVLYVMRNNDDLASLNICPIIICAMFGRRDNGSVDLYPEFRMLNNNNFDTFTILQNKLEPFISCMNIFDDNVYLYQACYLMTLFNHNNVANIKSQYEDKIDCSSGKSIIYAFSFKDNPLDYPKMRDQKINTKSYNHYRIEYTHIVKGNSIKIE